MAACVALLLRISHEVMFVDPHFRLQELRHRQPLETFLTAVLEERYGVHPTRIEIHIGDSLGFEYFKTECEQRLPSIVPEGIQVHIVRSPARASSSESSAQSSCAASTPAGAAAR
jgi:hypothetical protein